MKISFFERFYNWKYSSDINEELLNIQTISSYSQDDFLHWQDKAKWAIAKYHYEHNSFYRSIIGDDFPDSWDKLPIMTRDTYQNALQTIESDGLKIKDLYTNTTSGTTGQPLRFSKDFQTQARVWAAKKRFFNLHGVTTGSKEARIYAVPKEYKNIWIEKLKDIILNRVRFNVFDMSEVAFESWVSTFKCKKFEYIYGFTSAIVLFSRYLLKHQLSLKEICPTLKVCIVTSEVCTKEDKEIIEKAFGIKVVIEYGSKDVGLIGYECTEGSIHIPEENVYVELNENNEVVVTDLSNKAFPFIRYLLGDKLTLSEERCGCGSNNRIIKTLDGRSNELIQLPDGRAVPSLIFLIIIRSILESLGSLKEFTVCQTSIHSFTMDIVTSKQLNKEDNERLKSAAEKYLNTEITLTINQVKKIERQSSGKLKFFYSDLATI